MATSALSVIIPAVYGLLANVSATVYSFVPQNPSFPYVTLKSATENRMDTFGRAGKSCLLQAHVFTSSESYAGAGQALSIIAEIHEATNYAALTLAGFDCLMCRPEDAIDAGAEVINGIEYQHWIQFIRVDVMPSA